MKPLKFFTFLITVLTINNAVAKLDINEADRQIFAMINKEAGVDFTYGIYGEEVSWGDLISKVRTGAVQATGSATITDERKKWAKFTIPYNYEEEVVYTGKKLPRFSSVKEVTDYITNNKVRVGILANAVHAVKELNTFMKDPKNAPKLVFGESDAALARMLQDQKVDMIFGIRLSLHQTFIASDNNFVENRINANTPVAFILTKYGDDAVSDEDVAKLNDAITKFKANGSIQKIIDKVFE